MRPIEKMGKKGIGKGRLEIMLKTLWLKVKRGSLIAEL